LGVLAGIAALPTGRWADGFRLFDAFFCPRLTPARPWPSPESYSRTVTLMVWALFGIPNRSRYFFATDTFAV